MEVKDIVEKLEKEKMKANNAIRLDFWDEGFYVGIQIFCKDIIKWIKSSGKSNN